MLVVPDPPPPSKPLPPIPIDGNRKAKAATPPRNNQNQMIPFQSSQQNRNSGVFKPPARRPEVALNSIVIMDTITFHCLMALIKIIQCFLGC